jgi:hypothetical protein
VFKKDDMYSIRLVLKQEGTEMEIKLTGKNMVGCYTANDSETHIGSMITRKTACGKDLASAIFGSEVDVSCEKCLEKRRPDCACSPLMRTLKL